MLRNVLDVDVAAHKISATSHAGGILPLDVASAFPSLDHSFLWDMLLAFGLPDTFVKAIKMFYRNNQHFIRIGEVVFESIFVRSGVRQGCPLSPLLFAICSDLILRRVLSLLRGHEVVCAFADDTALVI